MTKEAYEKDIPDKLNKNFSKRSIFFEKANYEVFTELNTTVFEINKCIILELNRAAITLTNHFLERLLKIALITNEVGIGPTPAENWNATFTGSHEKYGSILLATSIELCKKKDLISTEEKDYLFNKIRNLMRNGFSHADPEKILKEAPDVNMVFQGDFSKPGKLTPINMNQKEIPVFQSLLIEKFAKENAEGYFDYVFELSKNIEKRLLAKTKNSK